MAARVLNSAPASGNAAPSLPRSAPTHLPFTAAPRIVHQALRSPGQPLDAETRALMEPHFGRDLSGVRIHTGPHAAESARAVHALAYTVGQDAVFAAGQFNPHSTQGRRLLAHELSHTVQQAGGARPAGLSAAAPALHRQPNPQGAPQQNAPKTDTVSVTGSWDDLLHRQLTPLSLLGPRERRPLLPSPGTLTLGGTSSDAAQNPYSPPFGFSPPLLQPGASGLAWPTLPGASPVIPSNPPGPSPLAPASGAASGTSSGAAPAAPSRLSVYDSGRFSLGMRLGFPEAQTDDKPGAPPSALQETLQKGEIINQIVTGKVPTAWQSLDKGKLAGAIWGIFSERIAPDVARKIASSMASKPTSKGVSYELDVVLLTDFTGAGASFTLHF